MADLTPKKINLAEINGGKQYEINDGIQPNAINDPIQASAYAQALATTQPNYANAGEYGIPKVAIEEVDGAPRFKFEDLRGASIRDIKPSGQDENGGNIYTITIEDGKQFTFTAPRGVQGIQGIQGEQGISIESVEQTQTSTESSGKNVITVTKTNGETSEFTVYNGATGAKLVSRVWQGEDQDGGNIYLDKFDDGTTAYFTAPRGRTADKISDWMGTKPIGDDLHYIYYDGEKFVARNVRLQDETTDWYQISIMADKIASGEKTPEELGLALGQEKTITLTTGEEVTFVILGFNHDDLEDGSGKAGITFGMKNLLATRYLPSYYNGTPYDWRTSYIKGEVVPIFYSDLPKDLRNVIKPIIKKSRYSSSTSKSITSTESIFLFSSTELGLSSGAYFGKKYEYIPPLVRALQNGISVVSKWWTRDLYGVKVSNGERYFSYYINEYGDMNYIQPFMNNDGTPSPSDVDEFKMVAGICFGFCI